MELDRLRVRLRPRRPWESLDLGFSLGRIWFFSLWPLWWMGAGPLALLWFLVLGGRADLWVLALWWFKPLYEAPLVVWTSRALFGETPAPRDFHSVFRTAWTRRLLPFLLWRRFGFSRSFVMPIVLLEGLRGAAARRRRRVLSDGDGTAAWLTLIGYHFEAILWGGLLLGTFFMVPDGLPRFDLGVAVMESNAWPYWLSCIFYLLAISILAPFYVCAGFALYLNRRTELEAWDLELAFRGPWGRESTRHATGASVTAPGVAAGMALAALLSVTLPGTDARANALPDAAQARDLIVEVLADERFGYIGEAEGWMPIVREPEQAPPTPAWLLDLAKFSTALGRMVQWTLLALAVFVIVLLGWRIRRDWRPSIRLKLPDSGQETGVDLGPEGAQGLPADLADAVRDRLRVGDERGAIALLYRGGIAALGRRGVEIPDAATEGDVLALAASRLPTDDLAPFRDLVQNWRGMAYGRRTSSQSVAVRLEHWLAWLGEPLRAGAARSASGAEGDRDD